MDYSAIPYSRIIISDIPTKKGITPTTQIRLRISPTIYFAGEYDNCKLYVPIYALQIHLFGSRGRVSRQSMLSWLAWTNDQMALFAVKSGKPDSHRGRRNLDSLGYGH